MKRGINGYFCFDRANFEKVAQIILGSTRINEQALN